MWQIDKVSFKNLFSHEDSEYTFKNNACTLIVGENKDNGGNNGAGKSTIFEAIAIALTNKSLRDVNKDCFINRDAESCLIKLELSNNVKNNTLCIVRQFFRGGKSSKVEITEDGEIDSTMTSVDEANKRIYELIGINRDDLLRYFIISQDSKYTFFTAGDTEKKEVMNRITSANMINPILDKLSNDKKDRGKDKDELQSQYTSISSKKETLEEQLQELLNNDNSDEINELKESISRYTAEIKNCENEKLKVNKEIEAKKIEISNIIIPDVLKLKTDKKKLKVDIDELEKKITDNKRIIRIAKSDLEDSTTCPECGAVFIKDSQLNLSVDETKVVLSSAESENESIGKKIDKINKQIIKINQDIDNNELLEDEKERLNRVLNKLKNKLSSFDDDISSYRKKISRNKQNIKELEEQSQNNKSIKNIKEKIKTCVDELNGLSASMQSIDEELDYINYWTYYMGKSGFMTYLANKAVSLLEGTVNSFLKKFKSKLSVNINGFKILKDGSVREKIEVFALENGMNAESFMSKSGGERGRINLAGVLAIQHLINMSTNGNGLNLVALDESFNGIDSDGQEAIIKILENLGITVLMITQNVSSEFNNENKMLIVKENGVSKITQSY
jgi:DNA repair exonuclease SbcCD ATPase subunit